MCKSSTEAACQQAADEAYQRELLATGLIGEIRLRRRDEHVFELVPVDIQGVPLSETIVQERR